MNKISIKFGRWAFLVNLAFLAMVVVTSPASADEVWSSDYGNVIYQQDRGKLQFGLMEIVPVDRYLSKD